MSSLSRSLTVIAILGVLAMPAAAKEPGLLAVSDSFQRLVETVSPSIVRIVVTTVGPSESTLLARERRGGAGVILTPDGYIVTNAHVVDGSRQLEVVLSEPASGEAPGRSILKPVGRRLTATLVGSDAETDLAVLKVDSGKLPHLALGDSDQLRPGQIVLAFGSPLGLENSVSMGIVSAVGRQLRPEDRMVYIQTDATINPGNSGGALVSAGGELVGINTLIFSQSGGSEGIGFAAPSNIVLRVFDQIRKHGRVRRGEIGAFAQTLTPVMARGLGLSRDWGAVIADVYPGGPADLAGLKTGDIVLRLNGKIIENGRQLDVNLYRKPVGEPVRLDVLRGTSELTINVPVVEREDDPDRFADLVTPEKNLIERLGILGIPVDDRIAKMLPWLRSKDGVVVAARGPNAPFRSDSQLQTGDVIKSLNRTATPGLAELRGALDRLETGAAVVLHVNRRGRWIYVPLELD